MVTYVKYTAPAQSVKVWSKPSYDVHKEKLSDARDLGAVRLNNSRLNAFAALEVGDEVDHFSFWVQSNGKTRLGMTDDPYLRVELLNSRARYWPIAMPTAVMRFLKNISNSTKPALI